MTIKELVDFVSNDCDMRRCFNLIAKSNDYYVAYEWLASQDGTNVIPMGRLKVMLGISEHTENEFHLLSIWS